MRTFRFAVVLVFSISVSSCSMARSSQAGVAQTPASQPTAAPAAVASMPHAAMLRYPDVGPTRIVFAYANDLWTVPRGGGMAAPLASPNGQELSPKFSPDGRTIAFVGNYDGNRDIYTIPVAGGLSRRITHHPAGETLCDWTPEGRLLFSSNGPTPTGRFSHLLVVSAEGGLPTKLPPPYGTNGAISPDGEWLAFTPHSRDSRTWKRYRGGMASDVWLFNLKDHSSKRITDWEGTDSMPMWHGRMVYYLSDAGVEHRLNIWSYEVASGRRRQLTRFADFDVKWPSIGPGGSGGGEIVFQNGSSLFLLDLTSGNSNAVSVSIPGDRPTLRAHGVDARQFLSEWGVSPTGKRMVMEARGDIWTAPAKNGPPRNLTRTSGVAERHPSWSADGRWIAYFSDASGEYELYITQSDGKGKTRQLTSGGSRYRSGVGWSPDSKMIGFGDKSGASFLHVIETGETILIDTDLFSKRPTLNWSPDSRWIAYTKSGVNTQSSIWIYRVEGGQKTQVTSGMFNDTWPTFDRRGDYLFFTSNREFSSPTYEDIGQSFVYADTDRLMVVPLRDEVGSPWAPKSDEESWGDDKEEDDAADGDGDDDKDGDEKNDDDGKASDVDEETDRKEQVEPVVIELENFEQRAVLVPVKRGSFSRLAVTHDGKLIYARAARRGSDGDSTIHIFDLEDEDKEEKKVVKGTGAFACTADGKKLLVRHKGEFHVVDAKADQELKDAVSLAGMTAQIDPRKEWQQIFHDAWRIQRDFFYDPNMHGLNWQQVHDRYAVMLEDCVSRRDVAFVIGEMISELNVGHAYVRGLGDVERATSVTVGMLGVDFELSSGAYRIARIYEGAPWDTDARGPLSEPGVDVHVGDYLLSVNGVPVDASKDPWASFQGLAEKVITLRVSANATEDDNAKDVVVKAMSGDRNLRYRAWIERNRAYVAKQTEGRVGYIYVPNTGSNGQNDLLRQFYGQRDKAALIIDERWNGGGQIPTRFIELLNRPATNYWAVRDGRDWTWPPDSHQGPKCMLINGLAGSGGDAFPAYFRQSGLGQLIGMRTWGGLVGISGNPGLIDGGAISAPTFAYYERDGTWGIEGHGVDPDIEVIDDPALMMDGGDPQLDRAISHMLEELLRNPYVAPRRPEYPDRSGMGIIEKDK